MKMTDFLDHISQVHRSTDYVITTLVPHSSRIWRCKMSNLSVLKSSQRVVLGCWQLFWNELGFLEKFWNFIRLWRQRRWFAAWKYEILTFTDRCCSDVTRSREILKRRLCSSTCVFKLCGMSKYFLPGMKDFSGGSDISARLFRNIFLNMKSQNQQSTSDQASNRNFISVFVTNL